MKLTLSVDAFWISPYSFSAFIALREKKLEFEAREIPLHQHGNDEPAYRRRSVTGLIPMLSHGDFHLAESGAIVNYLEERFPEAPRLLPAGIEARARARMVLDWIRSSRDLLALIEERSTATMFYEKARAPLSPAARESADKLLEVADFLIPEEAGSSLFEGAWSIADADLAFALHRLLISGDAVPAKLRRFAEAQWQRASVREFVAHARPAFVAY